MEHGQSISFALSESETVELIELPKSLDEGARMGEVLSKSLSLEESTQEVKPASALSETQSSATTLSSPSLLPKSIPLPANFASRLARPIQARLTTSPPILTNPKCSGYFVEPVSCALMLTVNVFS